MRVLLTLFLCLVIYSCTNYEKIGNYRYKSHIQRSNSGDFDGLIFKIKAFINKENDTVFFSLIKAQKLDFETENDTVFVFGDLDVIKQNEKVYIITKEININGYVNFTDTDSVIRTYEQFKGGIVKLNKIVYYRGGTLKKSYFY